MGKFLIKILYADSDPSSSKIIRSLINDNFYQKYDLEFFDNYSYLPKAIEKQKHDIYLIGQKVGDKMGLNIINHYSKDLPDKPFVYITKSFDCDADIKAMKAGAVDYLNLEDITDRLFERSVRYAISSKLMEAGLRNSQQFLIRLINYIPSPVFIKDKLLQFIMVNDSFCNFCALSREDIIGNKEYEILTDLALASVNKTDKHVFSTGEIFRDEIDIKLNSKNYTMLVTKALLKDFMGDLAIVGILTDITDQKNKQNELINSQNKLLANEKQLTLLNSSKDKLLSVIGHDLRGPVGIILQLADILNKEQMDINNVQQLAEDIRIQAVQTIDLLDNVLYWAKSQQKEMKIKIEKIDLNSLIEKNIELFSRNAKIKNIVLVQNLENDCFIEADRDMLNIVLRNLISNAIKFTNKNGKIEISGAKAGNNVEIIVSDNGVGMSKQLIEKITSNDAYKSTYGTQNEKGSGLGLKLCKDFIDMHKGKLSIQSNGKGTSVSFNIPIAN